MGFWVAAAPYIATAAGAIIGGLLNKDSQEDQVAQNTALQREFAQKGIQWKTADAKAAGLHPLYAMGANTTPYQSQPIMDDGLGTGIAKAGAGLGQYLAAKPGKAENKKQQALQVSAALNLSEQQRMLVKAQTMNLMSIMRYRNKDWTAGQGGPDGMGADVVQEETGVMPGMIEPTPVEQKSASKTNPDSVAGRHPAMRRYTINEGPMFLPDSGEGFGESLENVAFWMWPTIIEYNYTHLTPAEFRNLRKLIPGHAKVMRYWNRIYPHSDSKQPEIYRAKHRTSSGVIR